MHGYHTNIEKITKENTAYRRVLYTAVHTQLVVMCLQPGEEIGEEIHQVDQFIRFEEGQGVVMMNGEEQAVGDGDAVVIPAGTTHNVINKSDKEVLRLYSLYSPPEHKDGTLQQTKADEHEEHFDGKISEE